MLCEMVHLGPIHMLCLTCRSPPNINDATSMFGESAFRHFLNSEKHRIVRVRVCACVSVPTVVCEFIHIKIVTAAIIYYLPFEAFACPNMKCGGIWGGGGWIERTRRVGAIWLGLAVDEKHQRNYFGHTV